MEDRNWLIECYKQKMQRLIITTTESSLQNKQQQTFQIVIGISPEVTWASTFEFGGDLEISF